MRIEIMKHSALGPSTYIPPMRRLPDVTIEPLYDRIVVKRVDPQETTSGGIIMPRLDRPMEGEVLRVGEGKRNKRGELLPLDVQVGDKILFGKYAGAEVTIDGDTVLVMKEDEVLGVIE